MVTDKNNQNLEENERLPRGTSATLDAFRLVCAQIRPISGRIRRVPHETVGHSTLLSPIFKIAPIFTDKQRLYSPISQGSRKPPRPRDNSLHDTYDGDSSIYMLKSPGRNLSNSLHKSHKADSHTFPGSDNSPQKSHNMDNSPQKSHNMDSYKRRPSEHAIDATSCII